MTTILVLSMLLSWAIAFISFVFAVIYDKTYLYFIALIMLMLGLTFPMYQTIYREAETYNVTNSYSLPPELKGCNVYILKGNKGNTTLYVITRDNQPLATEWNSQGKHSKPFSVLTPVKEKK